MLIKNIERVIENTWPMIVIAAILLISLRLAWLYKNKKVIIYHQEILSLLFLIYILLLFQAVTFQDVSWSTSNYQPFKEIMRYKIGGTLFYKNVVGNLLMFIPFGFFVSYYLKAKKIYETFFLTLIASLSIEYTQLLIGRVFDIDDIILNITGSIIGFLLYRIVMMMVNFVSQRLKKNDIFTIIKIVLILICLFIIYIYCHNWWC